MLFDPAEALTPFIRWDQLREDLLKLSRLGSTRTATSLFVPPPRLWRPDTPARTLQLTKELISWGCSLLRERSALRRIGAISRHVNGAPCAPGQVALIISDLRRGGPERQLCNLAVGLTKAGKKVRIFTLLPLQGESAHYLPLLQSHGITHICGTESRADFPEQASDDQIEAAVAVIGSLPPFIRRYAWPIYTHLCAEPADALIAYLDHPNLVAAITGAVAGVRRVLLSVRNDRLHHLNSDQFRFRRYYRAMRRYSAVQFTGNTEAGNQRYGQWLGLPNSAIRLVRDGVDFSDMVVPSEAEKRELRTGFGLGTSPLILGFFLLSEEERLNLFLAVVSLVRCQIPSLQAVIIGDGPERSRVERAIALMGLAPFVRFVAGNGDIHRWMGAASVVLHTSTLETTQYPLLEAQYLQIPVVATSAGGAGEAIEDGYSGVVVRSDEPEALAEALHELVVDSARASRFGQAGKAFIARRFGLERMVKEYIALLDGTPQAESPPSAVMN